MTPEEFEKKFGYPYDQVDEEEAPSSEGQAFTLVEWLRLRAAIDSLTASTWVRFSTIDATVEISGRASPYRSHVRLAFAPVGVEGSACTVRARNEKHELLIEPVLSVNYGAPEVGGGLRMEWAKMLGPHRIVRPLITKTQPGKIEIFLRRAVRLPREQLNISEQQQRSACFHGVYIPVRQQFPA